MTKTGLTKQEFENLGYQKQPDGSYARTHTGQTLVVGSNARALDFDSVLTIPGIVDGLNGSDGLMRSHWSKGGRLKKLYCKIIRDHLLENKVRKHKGKVIVEYVGYKSILADWDNFGSSAKFPMDCLVKEGIIKDDKPAVVVKFLPQQIKCKRSEQKVVVIIKDAK